MTLYSRTFIRQLQLVQSVTKIEMQLHENESKPDQPSSDQTRNTVSDQVAGDCTTNILH